MNTAARQLSDVDGDLLAGIGAPASSAMTVKLYTGFSTTRRPSRGFGIGQICQSGL